MFTVADVRANLAEDVLIYLVDDENEKAITPAAEARIQEDIRKAVAEVNSYVAQRYTLPLPEIPAVLRDKAMDVVKYKLFSRRGIRPGTADETIRQNYEDALRWLRDLALGKTSLTFSGNSGSDGPAVPQGVLPRIRAARRVFSREKLEDF
jgi:phage gp36-like protein